MKVFLVHGELTAQETLASLIEEKLGLDVTIPEYLEEIILQPGAKIQEIKKPLEEEEKPRIDWDNLLSALEAKISYLKRRKKNIASLPVSKQMEIRDALQEADTRMDDIKTDV